MTVKKFLVALALSSSLMGVAPSYAEEVAAPAVVEETVAAEVAAPVDAAPAEAPVEEAVAEEAKIDSGDTAWMLTSTLLVILMSIPGLALFYGGLARTKNALSVLAQVFVIFSLITLLWAIYGYSLAFTGDGLFIGALDKVFLKGITPDSITMTLPEYVFVAFQSAFAAITVALIVGGFAERIKFKAVLIFSVLWFTLSYLPITHMVWGGGLLFQDGALDFAGGTVIHINAGVAALVGAYVVGKRTGYGKEPFKPHNLSFTLIGASLLWVGWFGFNAGSAAAANGIAGLAFVNTIFATGAAVLTWIGIEAIIKGKASLLGAASGAVAGLVAVTPAAGFIGPMGSILIGVAGGAAGLFGVTALKRALGADDSFDVFGVHGVAGIVGAILTGVLADASFGGVGLAEGVTIASQAVVQIKGVLITIVWSAIAAFISYKIAGLLSGGLRVTPEEEQQGLDLVSHGEKAYN
ncbi:ammonia channel protein [Amnimonas aquatica]|uniref:Ammonium transporter n=1 Tax=Amnimonas aquatica TaxID=2094561 RepID=A0A2P6AS19_9GAMM|nr:ammonia channel protein [Amnimonas aquatica]